MVSIPNDNDDFYDDGPAIDEDFSDLYGPEEEIPYWDRNLQCRCHRLDVCPDFEAFCDQQQAQREWDEMDEDKKEAIILWNAAWILVGPFSPFRSVYAPHTPF